MHTNPDDQDLALAEAIDSEKPIRPTGIETVRAVVTGHSFATLTWGEKGDKLVLDAVTANLLVKVHDASGDKTKAVFKRDIPKSRDHFLRLVDVAWKCVQ